MHRRAIGSVLIAVATAAFAVATGPAQTVSASMVPQYYVSLGDSLAQGVQPDSTGASVITNNGYPDQLFAIENTRFKNLNLTKLGCPGETTTTMISGGICTYPEGSQLNAATAFLSTHKIAFVTIDIGANNVDGCIINGVIDQACLVAGITAAATDLPIIMNALNTADPGVHIRAMDYYDPFLAAYLTGPAGQVLAAQSAAQTRYYNNILDTIYRGYGAKIADVASTFQTQNFTVDPAVGIPINVEVICQWTYMCAPSPVGPNIHATTPGYAAIAGTFAQTIRPNRGGT